MSANNNKKYKTNDQNGNIPWGLVIFLCFAFPAVGVPLLAVKIILMVLEQKNSTKTVPNASAASPAPTAQQLKKVGRRGRGLGTFLKIFGGFLLFSAIIVAITTFGDALSYGWSRYMFSDLASAATIGIGGLISWIAGQNNVRRANLYRKYTAVVGDKDSLRLIDIAAAIPTSYKKACKDMQRLIDQGAFGPDAYLDLGRHNFMRSASATPAFDPFTQSEAAAMARAFAAGASHSAEADAAESSLSESDVVIAQIRRLNDEIDDEGVSRRIDRIEKITADIFRLVEGNPAKRAQAKTFLDYYLPTTLKLLSSYSQFEDQAADGENIRAAKENIENILDSLVQGFELQLDRLFASDAMDISGDIRVLEQMMARDGLTEAKGTIRMAATAAGAAAAAVQKEQE